MKNLRSISKTSNISSLVTTVLLWILVFLLIRNTAFTGAGLSPNENVISLNLELTRGEKGKNDVTAKAPKIEKPEPVRDPITEPVTKTEVKQEPVKTDPVPVPKKEPLPKNEPVSTKEPVTKTEPVPEKEWKLAKSVDDSLGDLWSYDFVDVTESMDDIFDDDYGTKSGSQNAEINNKGSSTSASGNNGNGLEIRLKEVKERVLISPKEPVITLSRNASTLLTDNIKVHLVCTIKNSGTVSDVSFNPANVLPNSVMKEIRESLLSWIFNQGNSQTVTFELEIEP